MIFIFYKFAYLDLDTCLLYWVYAMIYYLISRSVARKFEALTLFTVFIRILLLYFPGVEKCRQTCFVTLCLRYNLFKNIN